jgi:hypothetical protein
MYYEDVFKELNKLKIRYLVIGGVAVNLYGFTRSTLDLDLVISLDAKNRDKFLKAMDNLNFKINEPSLGRKLMTGVYPAGKIKVLTFHRDEFEIIDVFIQDALNFEKAYKKKKIFKAGKINIPAVPYNMLIEMKRETGRERDLLDTGYLEKIRQNIKK